MSRDDGARSSKQAWRLSIKRTRQCKHWGLKDVAVLCYRISEIAALAFGLLAMTARGRGGGLFCGLFYEDFFCHASAEHNFCAFYVYYKLAGICFFIKKYFFNLLIELYLLIWPNVLNRDYSFISREYSPD